MIVEQPVTWGSGGHTSYSVAHKTPELVCGNPLGYNGHKEVWSGCVITTGPINYIMACYAERKREYSLFEVVDSYGKGQSQRRSLKLCIMRGRTTPKIQVVEDLPQ